jgi:hypothetical protein
MFRGDMLFARSPEECHLYMELHPCECGEAVFEWSRHRKEQRGDRMVSVYEGVCGRCGAPRQFEFEVTGEIPPPPAYGGEEPSRIIDPSEFLAVGEDLAAAVPPDPALLDPDALEDAYEAIEMAVAALDEVLKFVPAGADGVPLDAFRTDAGRQECARDPGQFGRERLTGLRTTYQRIRSAYEAVVG